MILLLQQKQLLYIIFWQFLRIYFLTCITNICFNFLLRLFKLWITTCTKTLRELSLLGLGFLNWLCFFVVSLLRWCLVQLLYDLWLWKLAKCIISYEGLLSSKSYSFVSCNFILCYMLEFVIDWLISFFLLKYIIY